MKAVLNNAVFCKQLVTMGIPMLFWWLSSSSLTIIKAQTRTGITVALTFHNFYSFNLKFWYLVIFSSYFTLIFWSPGTAMSMILHSLFSSSTMPGISLSVCIAKSQSILDFSSSCNDSDWCEYHCLYIQFQISCTVASALFSQVCCISSCIGFQLEQNTNWQNGRHFQLLPCRVSIEWTRPGDQCHF